ncbi:MAG: GNAT family N-acetyltransferase, partial [Ginsengibacter sp.]
MIIEEVNDKKSRKEFLLLPLNLYKSDPNYIAPLNNDIESVFDFKKNNFHSHGICNRWILKKDGLT